MPMADLLRGNDFLFTVKLSWMTGCEAGARRLQGQQDQTGCQPSEDAAQFTPHDRRKGEGLLGRNAQRSQQGIIMCHDLN